MRLPVIVVALLCASVVPEARATAASSQALTGVWYGTHVAADSPSPLHWKTWRQLDGRLITDYYVQSGCHLSYSHRELGRWSVRRGVYSVVTEQIGERKLAHGRSLKWQRFVVDEVSAERVRMHEPGKSIESLMTRVSPDFRMDTMDFCQR